MEEQLAIGSRRLDLEMYFEGEECEKEVERKMIDDEIFIEMKMAVDICVSLIALGVEDEIIAEATGLSLLDIQSIKW